MIGRKWAGLAILLSVSISIRSLGGKGRVEKIGESEYKHDMSQMSFAPRDLVV